MSGGFGSAPGPVAWGRRVYVAAAVLFLAVLVPGLVTAPRYGITSDEPVAYYGAQWQLWARTSQHPDRWNFKADAPREYADQAQFNTHPDPAALRMPAFPALVGAVVAPLAKHLPGYGVVDSVHAGLILLQALITAALALYLSRLLGLGRAVLVAAAYAAYPSVAGHMHFNVKDLPMAGLYALSLLSFAAGVIEDRSRFVVQSGVWAGLCFASKANAVFLAPTLGLWLPIAALLLFRGQRLPSRKVVAAVCLLPLVAFLTLYASWPYLRAGTLFEQGQKLGEMLTVMARFSGTGRSGFSGYSLAAVVGMTPPLLLLGLVLSVPAGLRASRAEASVAVLGWIWLLIPVLRIAAPHSNFYDGNRLFLEYAPALALLSGLGLWWGWGQLATRVALVRARPALARAFAVGVVALALFWPLAQYHPYEALYFNSLVGGNGGAQKSGWLNRYCVGMEFYCPDGETDYWASSFRNAVRDVNAGAAPGGRVYPCGNLMGPLSRWQGLRSDLRFTGRDEADWFVVIPRRPFCSEDDQRYAAEHGELVREVRRGGGLVYSVHRRKAGR